MSKLAFLLLVILSTTASGEILERLGNYTRLFGFGNDTNSNELWRGIIKDCSRKVSFSCIQKNAYTYLDRTLIDRDNITVWDGFSLTRNNLDYEACDPRNNLVDRKEDDEVEAKEDDEEENLSPLEEVTHALRNKAMKFLATRDYQIRLPGMIGNGAGIRISPREIDERGALVRIDFDTSAVERQQRLFGTIKQLKKKIANKIFTIILLVLLLIKIIKIKFFFVIPFLFGVGTAKKLFLKLLLFLVPAFAHVFKLCSSYYTSHATKYHHHHHKIAHHHHHIPVPVPVHVSKPGPVYFDHPPPSFSSSHSGPPPNIILDEDFQGYDYAHPHIQYRKDIEELKEWGIEPYDEPYDEVSQDIGVIHPGPVRKPPPPPPKFGFPKPPPPPLPPRGGPHAQSLAYAGYGPFPPPPLPPATGPNRQSAAASSALPVGVVAAPDFVIPKQKVSVPAGPSLTVQPQPSVVVQKPQVVQQQQQQQPRPVYHQQRNDQTAPVAAASTAPGPLPGVSRYDDEFYGPILGRLDEIFGHLRFTDENCRRRLVCSMYKNPELFSPHSNLVSNELSRDPQELQQGNPASASSQRFHQYLTAARLGQDGGDCLRSFSCSISTEQ